MRDFYEILEVDRGASPDDIKRAYRRLAMQYHPDRNQAADAEVRFKELSEAYDALRDPQKRAAYDRYGHAGIKGAADPGFSHIDLAEALNIFMRDFGGLGGFETLFAGGRAPLEARRGQDIRVSLKLTLAEVASGVRRTIKLRTLVRCTTCDGAGHEPDTRPVTCTTCAGSGEIRRAARSVFGQFVSVSPCPTCAGEGTVIQSPCQDCRGDGRRKGERSVAVEVPPGVSGNHYITLRGQGAAGPRNGPPGDLIVMIDVQEDEEFERQGDDLACVLPVSFSQAALGTSATLRTPLGEERLSVPAGVQSGTEIRLKGKGLPRLGRNGQGDLVVRVHVWTPESVSDEQRRLFRDLAALEGDPPSKSGGFWSRLKEALRA